MGINTTYFRFAAVAMMILFLAPCSPAQNPQPVSFKQIKTENVVRVKGLSQNMVNAIVQDKKGYLWFGTWDGLNQYDGYTFRIFNTNNGMSNPTVNALLEDRDGDLWIGTQNGLNRYDRKNRSFITYHHVPGESNSLSNNTINHLYQDSKGLLWISTVNGLTKYDILNETYSRINFNSPGVDTTLTNWVNKVVEDRFGNFWIATRYGLLMYNETNHSFKPFFHDPDDPASLSHNEVIELYEDPDGRLWIGTRSGLNLYLGEDEGFRCYYHELGDPRSISNNVVKAIYQDSHGVFWVGTQKELNIMDPEKGMFRHFRNTGKPTSLSSDDVNCIYEDNAGSVWIGTYDGVNKVNMGLSRFEYYHSDPDDPHSLSNDVIHAVFKDGNGKVWLGTGKGVNILDRSTGIYNKLYYRLDPETDLSDERVRSLLNDSQGNVWIGTDSKGLLKYRPEERTFRHYPAKPGTEGALQSNNILWIHEDREGIIWLCTDRGVQAFHPDSMYFRSWMYNPRDPGSISSNQVWIAYEDSKGTLWFGTDNGLNRYDRKTDRFRSYTHDPANPGSIPANAIYSIYEDSKGRYWIGTMGGGLSRFDPGTEKFFQYDESDGLPNNVVYITLEDQNGHLWLSTNWGLSRYDPINKEFINYGIHDGLQGNEFNGGAWDHAPDGEMFFGGMDGLNSFYPEEIMQNTRIPPIVITEIRKLNVPVKREFSNGDSIQLNYDDNYFSIEFSALDYSNPSKNRYRFKLENYDEDWVQRDASRRIAEYRRVDPGKYVFHVTGSNNDGYWNEEGCRLHIIILPPWWDTLLFRISFGVLIFIILWSFIYWRIRTIKKKHEVEKKVLAIEKELFNIEQKALQLQMNPHFIFNSLNAIQSFVISNNTDKAIHYLTKFSQLMRLILANSRESSIPVKDELKALTHYMDIERLRFDNKFDYRVDVDHDIDQEFTEIPPMIIQPFVENAILHGLIHSKEPGHIHIRLELREPYIFCIIEDNGIGREKAMEIKEASGIKRESRGMMITKERLEILSKRNEDKFAVNVIDLTDEQGHASGTRVEINILYYDE